MTKFIFTTAVFALLAVGSFGQNINNKINRQFMAADSVVLVSHLTTNTPRVDTVTHKLIDPYRLVEKNKVNHKIIKEWYRLNRSEIDSLSFVLLSANTDSVIVDIQCFRPHHGILLFSKSNCSYFDICFECRHFVTSKDIALADELSHNSWQQLFDFFKTRNLNYELQHEHAQQE